MNAFFIVGVQRSGTTLLATMLDKHPAIFMEKRSIAFRIITGFKNLYDLLPHNLQVEKNDFLAWLIKNDEHGRLAELIDYENIDQYQNIQDLIQHSIDTKLQENNKILWGDKSPNLQHYLSDLLMLMPKAKILHIIRDGRANAYSMSTRSYMNLSLSAQRWVNGNIFGLVNQDIIGKEKYKIIRYEDLLMDPEKEMKSVCHFLDIPYASELLDLSDDNLRQEKRYVKNYFDQSKIDRWKEQLSTKEIKKIEAIQGPLLKKMGYELMTPSKEFSFKPLSLRRQIFYNQVDNFRQLFRSKRMGMKNREKVLLHITIKSRVYTFFRDLTEDIASAPIFKTLFSRGFYRKKYFQKETKSVKNDLIL